MRIASPPSKGRRTGRAPVTHVIILDGTLSSLEPLCQTNAARAYTMLYEMGAAVSHYYEPACSGTTGARPVMLSLAKGYTA